MSSKRQQEGFLLIDNRNGPGVSADFIRRTGKVAPIVGEGAMYESATITCVHCNTVVILNPLRTRARHHCQKCDAYVCDNPGCFLACHPFNQRLDMLEAKIIKAEAKEKQSFFSLSRWFG